MRRLLPLIFLILCPALAGAQTHVASGGNLQTALTNAACGDTITLEAGATFAGNFTLPSKGCTAGTPVTLRTVTADGTLGTDGITPSNRATFAPLMATLASSNSTAALRTVTDASHWRFVGLIFQNTTSVDMNIVELGDGVISSLASLPTGFVFTQCIFTTTGQAHRGLAMNAGDVTVRKSHFYGIRLAGVESHSMSCYNCPGPFLIEDNYIEAASIGTIFGGAVPAISGLIPSDIVVRRNTYTRDVSWQSNNTFNLKNCFELKNAQRVEVYGNLFENNWPNGQAGYCIVITVRANGDTAPWTTIQDVDFHHNIVRNTAMGFNILGIDTQTAGCTGVCDSTRMEDVTIRHNYVQTDRDVWTDSVGVPGSGYSMLVSEAPTRLTVDNNTFVSTSTTNGATLLFLNADTADEFVFTDNIWSRGNTYGIFGNAVGEGNAAINTFTDANRIVTGNVFANSSAAAYNSYSGNFFPTNTALLADFVDPSSGNYRLLGASIYLGKGADFDAIDTARGQSSATTRRRIRFRLAE